MEEVLRKAKYVLRNDVWSPEPGSPGGVAVNEEWINAAEIVAAAFVDLYEKPQPETAKVTPPGTSPS